MSTRNTIWNRIGTSKWQQNQFKYWKNASVTVPTSVHAAFELQFRLGSTLKLDFPHPKTQFSEFLNRLRRRDPTKSRLADPFSIQFGRIFQILDTNFRLKLTIFTCKRSMPTEERILHLLYKSPLVLKENITPQITKIHSIQRRFQSEKAYVSFLDGTTPQNLIFNRF